MSDKLKVSEELANQAADRLAELVLADGNSTDEAVRIAHEWQAKRKPSEPPKLPEVRTPFLCRSISDYPEWRDSDGIAVRTPGWVHVLWYAEFVTHSHHYQRYSTCDFHKYATDIRPVEKPPREYTDHLREISDCPPDATLEGWLKSLAATWHRYHDEKPPAPRELIERLEKLLSHLVEKGYKLGGNFPNLKDLLAAVRRHSDPELPTKLRDWADNVEDFYGLTACEMRQLAAELEGKPC